ncbi:RluA family pseudouridine synthase [Marinagarivorans algicola]|uniref:RluA family pseudouridine synthase n=1 Tax=Marinagarivorans algicola TaxID=1513270 RepID=UPI0006B5466C|nr:RluA family pseudouridine synthase [Marinagarivorans algicola]
MQTSFLMHVTPKQQAMTLYDFLDLQFPFFVKKSWSQVLVADTVTLQGLPVIGNPLLKAGDVVAFSLHQYSEPTVNTQWRLYWQNEALLVVHKPANLPVQRTTRNIYNTLTALVRRDLHLPEAQPLHRLDLETAGLVLFAKNKLSTRVWQPQLKSLLQKKIYQAVVWGKPVWRKYTFTCRLATQAHSPIRCKMYCTPEHSVAQPGQKLGKLSTTHFTVLKSFTAATGNGRYDQVFSVVACELQTGRKHQIRAQLAHLGHPIVGDKIYAHDGSYYLKRLRDATTEADEQMLLTDHHLLVACSAQLQGLPERRQEVKVHQKQKVHAQQGIIDNQEGSVQQLILKDEDYPIAWQRFIG